MKTLNRYIGGSILLVTGVSAGVLTFVMLAANLFKAFELIARGVGFTVLLRFLVYLLPDMLTFTIPLSLLCAAVLVFSRFAADNEVTAMRASGISLWQIISPGLILSITLSLLCFWLHTSVGPRSRYRADMLMREEGAKNPVALLEPGRYVELPGYLIRIGDREGSLLKHIRIIVVAEGGRVQDITARRGRISVNEKERLINLRLEDATVAAIDLRSEETGDAVQRFATREISFPLDYGAEFDRRRLSRKLKYMDMGMIFGRIYLDRTSGVDTTPAYVELHTRMAMALSPFAFLLMGIPFGIRTRRAETSVGLAVCLFLAMGFYAFILLAESLKHQPSFHPELLVWLPNIVYQVGELAALAMLARR